MYKEKCRTNGTKPTLTSNKSEFKTHKFISKHQFCKNSHVIKYN